MPAHNSTWSVIHYRGLTFQGPRAIYLAADPERRAKEQTFAGRMISLRRRKTPLTDALIDFCLYSDKSEYHRRYGRRRTLVTVAGDTIDLEIAHADSSSTVPYRTVHQRVKRLITGGLLDQDTLSKAFELTEKEWITRYGGGRRRGFVYTGELFPHLSGTAYSGITHFLLDIGRYSDHSLIHSRLKRHWPIDAALTEPSIPLTTRTGSIYQLVCKAAAISYVGLTITAPDVRWSQHRRDAERGVSQMLVHQAIRQHGAENFDLVVLERDIPIKQLQSRERHWIHSLGTQHPAGLNAREGGQMGGGRPKEIQYGNETFRSLEDAASILSQRTGLQRHVVLKRLNRGEELPVKARSHSKHAEAGTNLWRRWKSLLKRTSENSNYGVVCDEWANSYDQFAADVKSGYRPSLQLTRINEADSWRKENVHWVTRAKRLTQTHGRSYLVFGVRYASLNELARAHGIGATSLRDRIERQGLTPEEAVSKKLAATSYRAREDVSVDGQVFRSITSAAKYAAEKYGLTSHQARDRLRRNVPLDAPSKRRNTS